MRISAGAGATAPAVTGSGLRGIANGPVPAERRQDGFTLIELLVVMVIIGSLLSLAVLSTGNANTSRELRDEAQRLSGLIAVLSDEAVLDNREYGLLVRSESYRVLAYDEAKGVWAAVPGQNEHRMPVWARLELELEGEPLKLSTPVKENDDEPGLSQDEEKKEKEKNGPRQPEPQLLILSSGELSPFRLEIAEREPKGTVYELVSDGFQMPKAELAKERR